MIKNVCMAGCAVVCAAVLWFGGATALAQVAFTGQITGTVTDTSQAVVPGATVTVRTGLPLIQVAGPVNGYSEGGCLQWAERETPVNVASMFTNVRGNHALKFGADVTKVYFERTSGEDPVIPTIYLLAMEGAG